MSSAAQHDETSERYLPSTNDGGTALKQIAAERLAAHRSRRAIVEGHEALARREQVLAQTAVRLQARRDAARADIHPDATRVRDKVAARYQQSVSYRELLAVESQRALEQAQAEAEVAARNAIAVAAAQRQLLDEIDQWNRPEGSQSEAAAPSGEMPLLEIVNTRSPEAQVSDWSPKEASVPPVSIAYQPGTLQVRMHHEIELPSTGSTFYAPTRTAYVEPEELEELDQEIEFRRSPEFHHLVMETQPIPANIIEFPRQLVASRKARPRLAEGPLRADGTQEPQLRIFEVEAENISQQVEADAAAAAPEWQGLLLGDGISTKAAATMSPQLSAQLQLDHQLYAASVPRRLLSSAVDALCVAAGFAGSAAVVIKITGQALRNTPLPLLGGAAAGTFLAFLVMYHLLFFSLNDATPGMRAARLAFCTFSEKSPSRKAIRRRFLSTALAACPLGLGLLWTALDSDGLGWHDRMSRMYPRSY